LYAVDRGYLDDVELEKVSAFESALQAFMASDHGDFMQSINDDPKFNDEVESKIKAALDDFKSNHTW
jgi:F-type H+-transporting ATPase subunit alpha